MTFTLNRRGLALAAVAGTVLARSAKADGSPATDLVQLSRQRRDPDGVLPLWPGTPPGGEGVAVKDVVTDHGPVGGPPDRSADGVSTPTLAFFRSASPGPRATILVIPGGGYSSVWFDKEGDEIARWLNTTGLHAAVLTYRLPAEGWKNGADVPLQDAQRAMRLLRAKAKAWAVDGGRIGIIGFSAGGHLAASLLTRHDAAVYTAVDEADKLPAGPQLACLAYPVISMDESLTHPGSRQHLLGNSPSAEQVRAYSPDQIVRTGACPTFLFHAADDDAVPVGNSLAMFQALRRQNVATEMHIFESGGHGFAIRDTPGRPAEPWPDLYRRWLSRHGFV